VAEFTDEQMRAAMTTTRPYSVVILKAGPNYGSPEAATIIWEHGRRNFSLRADGLLAIVCPVRDDTDVCGIGIFTTDEDQTREIMDDDPGVRAGVFTYDVHPCRSFPGDSLPA
jgi:hypothetical protein